jgi:hypothetical protein
MENGRLIDDSTNARSRSMAIVSDLVTIPAADLAHGKPTPIGTFTQDTAHPLPDSANVLVKPPVTTATITPRPGVFAASSRALHQVVLLNKNLNDSGQPNRYRLAANAEGSLIQEINPATGEVIGEYSVSTFPTLAKSLGLVGSLIDSRA